MAHAARIATATVAVVVSAFGALTGRTSSSTSQVTASASARPTNTTNAYILLPPLRRTARRSPQFDYTYDAWLQAVGNYFSARRSNHPDGRRPGARQGLPARRGRGAGRFDPGDVRGRVRALPPDARRPGRSRRRDAGGVRAGHAIGPRVPRRVGVRDLAASRDRQRLP